MNKMKLAKEVLLKAREQLITELAQAGASGGVGRSHSYAPILVNLHNALGVIQDMTLEDEVSNETPEESESQETTADRMARVRAAKQNNKA